MNEKQQQLTFGKGITNVPSDAICSDNTLDAAFGMVYDDGEHRVIQAPASKTIPIPQGRTLIYVHKIGSTVNYISSLSSGHGVFYYNNNAVSGSYVSKDSTVTSIGKTLIINTDSVISYFLWKDNTYSKLAYPLPDLNFRAAMSNTISHYAKSSAVYKSILYWDPIDHCWYFAGDGKVEDYNNLVVGLYAKNRKSLANDKIFFEPFFVRAALELYDGSYTYITNPILLFPSVNRNTSAVIPDEYHFRVTTYGARLFLSQTQDYSDYADIVRDVVVFASKGVPIYNTEGDQPLTMPSSTTVPVHNSVAWQRGASTQTSLYDTYEVASAVGGTSEDPVYGCVMQCLRRRTDEDIKGDIEGTSVFYRLCSLGIKPTHLTRSRGAGGTDASFVPAASLMADYVLPNLTTQEQLRYDDYFSRSEIRAEGMYAYNARLNLYGIQRKLFQGFSFFMPLDSSDYTYTWYVRITTEQGEKWVHHTASTNQLQGHYFFYPDTRATEVVITYGNTVICSRTLQAHPALHGAYYLRGLPTGNTMPSDTGDAPSSSSTSVYESLPNYVLTSEVNNPWVIKAEGYYAVGTGRIIGLSTLTTALSEGQFGQFPLLVFSQEGIWAMALNATGMFTSVHPMSREVCSNPKSITQTDGAVFFVSEKGLMVVMGNTVKCVSEQLAGEKQVFDTNLAIGVFHTFFQQAFIAYDYRDSLLWIFNSGSPTCLVYAIKSGTFAYASFNNGVTNVVNNYPDYLLQDIYHNVFTLTGRPDINSDTKTDYSATLLTRPMKLENALALKTIMQVRHIHDMNTSATISLQIYASNNLKNWVELSSLRGTPWKYYRFRYQFTHLKATDRFSGTVVVTEERRTNKIR